MHRAARGRRSDNATAIVSNYRRVYSGTTWFFTVVTYQRRPILVGAFARDAFRAAILDCRRRYPFRIDAWVLLPDHLHAIWTLPDSDRDYSRRWSMIKRGFTQRMSKGPARERNDHERCLTDPLWQPRFWAHRLDDEADHEHHVNYVHINPLKHGFVERVVDWQWSSFHRLVREGTYPSDWGGEVVLPEFVGRA